MNNLLSVIDLTSLSPDDTNKKITKLCHTAIEKKVAAICVFPTFIKTCKENLPDNFPIATVVGGFPHGQVPLEVKKFETKIAIDLGASEIDMVINRSFVLSNDIQSLKKEISSLANLCQRADLFF